MRKHRSLYTLETFIIAVNDRINKRVVSFSSQVPKHTRERATTNIHDKYNDNNKNNVGNGVL